MFGGIACSTTTTAKAKHETFSGCEESITENIDVTYVPAVTTQNEIPPAAAISAPTNLDGAWVKLEHSDFPAHTWLYGHQGKLYRLNHPEAPADAPPTKPTRIAPKELWYGDNLGRTFGQAESFSYTPTAQGFALNFRIPTMRGEMCLSGAISNDGGYEHVRGSTVQVTLDSRSECSVSGSCKGYFGMDMGLNANIVSRITIYK